MEVGGHLARQHNAQILHEVYPEVDVVNATEHVGRSPIRAMGSSPPKKKNPKSTAMRRRTIRDFMR
jgi:hypothetical protein